MIRPEPESDLRNNTMVLGAEVIDSLQTSTKSYILIEELLRKFLESGEKRTPEDFLQTLTFLYTIGIIEEKNYKIRLTQRAKNGSNQTSTLSDFTD
jgi:hypothetical protein